MEITKDLAHDIRSIENKLIEEFKLDLNDQSFNFALMFNDDKCKYVLSTCVVPLYCQCLYKDFIKPIYFYLEYRNNYLTVDCIADHNDMTKQEASNLIERGRNKLKRLLAIEEA